MITSTSEKKPVSGHEQDNWKELFLQRILATSAIIGIFALIAGVLSTDDLVLQSIYIGVYAVLVASILIRLPYFLKAYLFAALPLVLGISTVVNFGTRGNNLFFLLAYVTFSTLLIGSRGGLIALFVSEVVIIVTGFLVHYGYFLPLNPQTPTVNFQEWITNGILQLLISLVIIGGFRMLQEGYTKAKARVESTLETLRKTQAELENRVMERTKELARKTSQMNASTFVAHQTAAIQDINTLLNSTVELIAKQFGYYHVALYLINERGDYAILQSASSEGGKRLLEQGYRLRVGVEGIIGFVAAEKKPRISLDVGEDSVFFDNPELPETRSELSLPLIVRNKVIGVLDMQSTKERAFSHDEIDMFQTLADQIAIAIENTRLLTESQLIISQLEVLSGETTRRNWMTESISQKSAFQYSATGIRPVEKAEFTNRENTLSVPLILRGQKIGKISLHRQDKFQNWTTQEETVASEVAAQTALALENIRLVERTRQSANREQAISTVTNRIRETLDLDTVLRTSAREIQRALNLQEAEIRLISQNAPSGEQNSQNDDGSQARGKNYD